MPTPPRQPAPAQSATAPLPVVTPGDAVEAPPPHHPGWRERHAAKRAAKELASAEAAWAADQAEIEQSIDTVRRLLSGGGVAVSLVLKAGEQAIWSGTARLVEPRRGPGHYAGGSQGVSFRIAKGVRYRVGATRGHYVPGDEVQTVVDSGTVTVTTQRAVFTGLNATREWSFAKLLDTEVSHDRRTVLIHVSNRQKVSGVQTDHAFADALGLGITVAQNGSGGLRALLDALTREAEEHRRQRPSSQSPA